MTRGLPPPDPRSLSPLSSTEFVEPPPNKIRGYATGVETAQHRFLSSDPFTIVLAPTHFSPIFVSSFKLTHNKKSRSTLTTRPEYYTSPVFYSTTKHIIKRDVVVHPWWWGVHEGLRSTVCPTRYRTRHFFNNCNTNEDIATKFEQEYVRCVRNEEECVCSPLQISLQYYH